MGLSWLSWIAGDAFNSMAKIQNIQCPTLFIHGDQDQLIPINQGRILYEACPAPKSFQVVRNTDHNNIMHRWSWRFWPMVNRFLKAPQTMQSSDDALARPNKRSTF